MARRSLRDEMMYGAVVRSPRGRKRGRWRVPVAVMSILAVVIGAIILLSGVQSPASDRVAASDADTAPIPAPTASAAPSPAPSETAEADPQSLTGEAADVRRMLDALPLVPGTVAADYNRDLFGQAWYDYDRNGCDTRNDVLRRDLRDVVLKDGTNGCKVLGGVLDDWYSGTTVTFVSGGDTSRLVQVDHVVPLSWAWQHGANAWSDDQRMQFANDPRNLNATTDQENSSKSDSGPSQWLPTSDVAQCRYVQRFTEVLSAYPLGIDLRDRAMIRGVIDECAASALFGAFDAAE